jgi:hypothetical protein
MATRLCNFCQKPVHPGGGGMMNHIKKSPGCFSMLGTQMAQGPAATSDQGTNQPAFWDEFTLEARFSSPMDLDPEPYSPTNSILAADDPPPDPADDSEQESSSSYSLPEGEDGGPEDEDSNLEDEDSDLEDEDSGLEDEIDGGPFTFPLAGIDVNGRHFSYQHFHKAGIPINRQQQRTQWEMRYDAEGPNNYFPWVDLSEWELVEWLVDQRLSQKAVDDFIKNKWVQD